MAYSIASSNFHQSSFNDRIHSRFVDFLINLECLDAHGQFDAFANEVIETFGRLTPPTGDRSHQWELDLYDVFAEGASEEEVIANWKRLAHAKWKRNRNEESKPKISGATWQV